MATAAGSPRSPVTPPRQGLACQFLRPQTDYDNADACGHTGVLDAWALRPRRVYEVSRPVGPPAKNWREIRRMSAYASTWLWQDFRSRRSSRGEGRPTRIAGRI
ncbi:hypothetical protein ACR820_34415 [Streptomyces netropsis]